VDVLDGSLGSLGRIENDEGLALGLEVRLGDDIDHVAILGEDGAQRLLEGLGLDALFQITDVNPVSVRLVWPASREWGLLCMCRSAMTHT
jgi:hypothetical protein